MIKIKIERKRYKLKNKGNEDTNILFVHNYALTSITLIGTEEGFKFYWKDFEILINEKNS